jgi:hypothetical protein
MRCRNSPERGNRAQKSGNLLIQDKSSYELYPVTQLLGCGKVPRPGTGPAPARQQRLANEYAAQEREEVVKAATRETFHAEGLTADIGLTHNDIHEAHYP